MGQIKMQKVNNYFEVIDVTTSGFIFPPVPSKEIRYENDRETIFFYATHSGKRLGFANGFHIGLTGTVQLTAGASGSIDGIQVGGVEIMSGAKATAILATVLANTQADGTVTIATVLAGQTVTANGLLYTAVDGVKADLTEFSADGTNADAAIDLAHSIDQDTRAGTLGNLTALTPAAAVVTMVSDQVGAAGNAVTLVSSNGTTLAVSGAGTLTDGYTADILVANGLTYTAVVGKKANNTQFSIDGTDTAAALDLADSITKDTRAGTLNDLTAKSAVATVTMTQTVGGAGGKATTLTETGGNITISGATFDAPEDFDTDLDTTAANVAANINAYTSVPNYTAVAVTDLVTIKIATPLTAVDGKTVVSEATTITTVDANVGLDANDIVDSGGTPFASLVLVKAFLDTNTGP